MAEAKTVPEKPKPQQHRAFWPPAITILWVVAIYFAAQIVAAIGVSVYPAVRGWNEQQTKAWLGESVSQFVAMFFFGSAVIGMVWLLLKLKNKPLLFIGWQRLKLSDFLYALSGFGLYFLLYVVVALVAQVLSPSIDFEQQQQLGFEVTRAPLELTMVFVALVIVPPLAEEILMRGFLYSGLVTKWPKWIATLIVSVLFAVAHLQFGSGAPLLWVAAIDTFALSLVLVYLREKTGGLGAPILLHMLKNGIAFTLLFIIGTN